MMTTLSSSMENFPFPEVVHKDSFAIQAFGDDPEEGSVRGDHAEPLNKSKRAYLYKALKTSTKYAGKQLSKISPDMSGHRRSTSKATPEDTTDTTCSLDQSSFQCLPQQEDENELEDDPLSLLPAAPTSLPEIVRKLQETPAAEQPQTEGVRREGLSQKRASLMCPIGSQPDVVIRKEALLQRRASLLSTDPEPESPTSSTRSHRRRRPRKMTSSSSGKSKSKSGRNSRRSSGDDRMGESSRMSGSRKSRSSKSSSSKGDDSDPRSSRGRSSRPSTSRRSSTDGTSTKGGNGRRGRSRSVSVAAGKARGNSKRPSGRRRSRSVSVQAHSRSAPVPGPLTVPNVSAPVEAPVEDPVAVIVQAPPTLQDNKISQEEEILQASLADDIACTWAVAVPTNITTAKTSKITKNINMNDWQCSCGENNSEHFQFCGMCGSAPTWQCVSCCRSDNLGHFKFCVGCGSAKQ